MKKGVVNTGQATTIKAVIQSRHPQDETVGLPTPHRFRDLLTLTPHPTSLNVHPQAGPAPAPAPPPASLVHIRKRGPCPEAPVPCWGTWLSDQNTG